MLKYAYMFSEGALRPHGMSVPGDVMVTLKYAYILSGGALRPHGMSIPGDVMVTLKYAYMFLGRCTKALWGARMYMYGRQIAHIWPYWCTP